MSFTVDFSDFNKEFKKLSDKFVGKHADEALFNAAAALKHDADTLSPTTPKKKGTLRSTVAFKGLNNKFRSLMAVIWKMPYAAYQHEGRRKDGTRVIKKYSEPGSGPDYAGSKLKVRGKIYRDIMGMTYKSKQ